jgi:hypothetical protein
VSGAFISGDVFRWQPLLGTSQAKTIAEIRVGLSFSSSQNDSSRNELTLPDAAWFPNDKKGSDERSTSVSNQMNDFANSAEATIRWI